MTAAVECWQWMLTARPDLKLRFLQEMFAAWQYTVDKRIGLFSVEDNQINPLAVYEGCKLGPNPPIVKPHEIWVSFIIELIGTTKYCCQETVEMVGLLLHRSLPMCVGTANDELHLNRNIAAVGVRFKLLSCGLNLLEGDIFPKSLSKDVLRERVHCNCLDYFCRARQSPTQELEQLKEDIATLIRFWKLIHSDIKYLSTTKEETDLEIIRHSQVIALPSFVNHESFGTFIPTGSDFAKSSTSTWINTVPHSTSSNNMSKRSIRSKRFDIKNICVKDYIRKRNLILELLVVELELLLVSNMFLLLLITVMLLY
jgi:phosphatidylinositol 4-kinase